MLLVGKYSVHSDGNKFEFDVELSHDKKSSYLEVLIESDSGDIAIFSSRS